MAKPHLHSKILIKLFPYQISTNRSDQIGGHEFPTTLLDLPQKFNPKVAHSQRPQQTKRMLHCSGPVEIAN